MTARGMKEIMSRPNKYQAQASLGIAGLFLIATPLFIKLPSQFYTFNSTTEIEVSENIERARIEQKKQTADLRKETGVLPTGTTLTIRDYFDTPKWNPNPITTPFLEDEIVFVYDSAGICIGKIQKRKWLWKHFYKNICNNAPVQ